MIITRKNKNQAYLVFATNGEIKLDRKTIGTWRRRWKRKFSEDYRMFQSSPVFSATVTVGAGRGTSNKYLENNSKYGMMQAVASIIPDNMLKDTVKSSCLC